MSKYTIRDHKEFDGNMRVFLTDPTQVMIMGSPELKKYINQRIDEHQSKIEYWDRLKKLNEKVSQEVDID